MISRSVRRCAVHQSRLLEGVRQLPEEPDEEPDRQRHRERQVREDEAGIRVQQVQRAKQEIERRHDRDLRKHRHRQHQRQHDRLAAKAEAGERIRARRPQNDGQQRRRSGDD
jgi:hypothetical protein